MISEIKSQNVPANVGSGFGLFFVFGNVKDGSNYYTNSIYIPIGYKLSDDTTIPDNMTLVRRGNYYHMYTSDNSLAGKATNIITSIIPDI